MRRCGCWPTASTCNHVHLLARAESSDGIACWLQEVQGCLAQFYNRRKGRSGAFWEGRYHSTLIDSDEHLQRCMTYIELNMVRARVVPHPEKWPWCSYHEWMGQRQRRALVNLKKGLEFFGNNPLQEFQANCRKRIEEAIAKNQLQREPCWTESIAVGREEFVKEIASRIRYRQTLDSHQEENGSWVLRDASPRDSNAHTFLIPPCAQSLSAKNELENGL
jgi:REP-associated tyrosine transposase